MTSVEQAVGQPPAGNADNLRESAAGWQKIQFTVLGFIGLCGVLKGIGTATGPRSLEVVAAVLIVVALIVACVAIFLVGRVAWPVRSAGAGPGGGAQFGAARSLRTGLALTVVALILASLAATSSWWPAKAAGDAPAIVRTSTGLTYCGTWVGDGNGVLILQLARQLVSIPLAQVTTVDLTSSCG
jgi:hypothetical protein